MNSELLIGLLFLLLAITVSALLGIILKIGELIDRLVYCETENKRLRNELLAENKPYHDWVVTKFKD